MKYLDPYREQREAAKKRAAALRKQLGRAVALNEYEQLLAVNVMNPDRIDVTLDDGSGLEHLVHEMEVKVLLPLGSDSAATFALAPAATVATRAFLHEPQMVLLTRARRQPPAAGRRSPGGGLPSHPRQTCRAASLGSRSPPAPLALATPVSVRWTPASPLG